MKTCTSCQHEGPLADYEQFDLLCRVCRSEKGPRQRMHERPSNGQRRVLMLPDKPKPKPSGRRGVSSRIHRERAEAIA